MCGNTEYAIAADNEEKDAFVEAIVVWFNGLRLEKCERPEPVEGNVLYDFVINRETAFIYNVHGAENTFVIVESQYYKASNPSLPPVEALGSI